MALYHFHVGQIKRSAGRSAVECAAYRAGEKLYSEYYGQVSDYTRKGGVMHAEILLPPHAPRGYADRQTLWNAVEEAERNKNAQLAYSFDIALQNEFTMEENMQLARQFLLDNFVSRGMIADFAVHQPDKDGGIPNPHFHVMCPIRPLNLDGTWGAKQRRVYHEDGKFDAVPTTDWGKPDTLEAWREAWAALCNAKFEEKGLPCRIDRRSYERQGIEQIPTVHEGVAVRQMEAKGIVTDKGEHNRWIRSASTMLRTLGERIKTLVDWLSDTRAKLDKPYSPSLGKLLADYFDERNAGAWSNKAKVGNLKRLTSAIAYLNENGLHTLDDLNPVWLRFMRLSIRRKPRSTSTKKGRKSCVSCSGTPSSTSVSSPSMTNSALSSGSPNVSSSKPSTRVSCGNSTSPAASYLTASTLPSGSASLKRSRAKAMPLTQNTKLSIPS